jgi:hypothetical protein
MTRVGIVSKVISSRTANPFISGIRRSRSRMSGFSLPSFLIHSVPLLASPTILISSSDSSSLRRASRKMAWSSAISILILERALAILASSSALLERLTAWVYGRNDCRNSCTGKRETPKDREGLALKCHCVSFYRPHAIHTEDR